MPAIIPIPTKTITVPDHEKTGAMMRQRRERAKLSLREVARRLGYSAPYVSQLERGLRTWSDDKLSAYLAALQS